LTRIRQRSNELDINFLENDAADIDGVRFLGCMLWTDFMMHGSSRRQTAVHEAHRRMTDYRQIKHDRRAGEDLEWKIFDTSFLHTESTVKRHLASVEWLKNELKRCNFHGTVVVTHHAPYPQSVPPHYQNNALAPAYASNLDDLMGRCALWIHGHIWDSTMTWHIMRVGQTLRRLAMKAYFTAGPWQSSRVRFWDVALHRDAAQFALESVNLRGRFAADRSIRQYVQNALTLLVGPAPECAGLDS